MNALDQWLATQVKGQMKAHEMTISDVARAAGLSRQHVSNILLGIRSPSTTVWCKVLEGVGFHPEMWSG